MRIRDFMSEPANRASLVKPVDKVSEYKQQSKQAGTNSAVLPEACHLTGNISIERTTKISTRKFNAGDPTTRVKLGKVHGPCE